MAKAETEGHDHEVTIEKVKGKDQVVLVKGCDRCDGIREARKFAAYMALKEEQQGLYDSWYELGTKEPTDSTSSQHARWERNRKSYEDRMSSLDKDMDKLHKPGGKPNNWKTNLTYKP